MYNPWFEQLMAAQMAQMPQMPQMAQMAQMQQMQQMMQMVPMMTMPYPTMSYPMGTANRPTNSENHEEESETDEVDDEQQRTLFVANLDERVTDELLYEVFLQAGPIESVRIPKDKTGQQRTFGFVTYTHACTPEYAIRLFDGLQLFRKNLTLRFQGKSQAGPASNPRQNQHNNRDHHNHRDHHNNRDQQQHHRRSGGSGDNGGPKKFDNSSLRSTNYSAFTPSNSMQTSTPTNPFKSASSSAAVPPSPTRKDWTSGSAAKRSSELRSQPYDLDSLRNSSKNRSRDPERHQQERNRSRGHYNDGNRRSNQRNNRI